jgi:hypothetical protein
MSQALFILWIMYWGSDGRAAMSAAEYHSRESCEAAKAAVSRVMDSKFAVYGDKTYAVCTKK